MSRSHDGRNKPEIGDKLYRVFWDLTGQFGVSYVWARNNKEAKEIADDDEDFNYAEHGETGDEEINEIERVKKEDEIEFLEERAENSAEEHDDEGAD